MNTLKDFDDAIRLTQDPETDKTTTIVNASNRMMWGFHYARKLVRRVVFQESGKPFLEFKEELKDSLARNIYYSIAIAHCFDISLEDLVKQSLESELSFLEAEVECKKFRSSSTSKSQAKKKE